MFKLLSLVVLVTSVGAACTPQQVYDTTHTLRVDQCQQLPAPDQEECMRQTHETQPEREDREDDARQPR